MRGDDVLCGRVNKRNQQEDGTDDHREALQRVLTILAAHIRLVPPALRARDNLAIEGQLFMKMPLRAIARSPESGFRIDSHPARAHARLTAFQNVDPLAAAVFTHDEFGDLSVERNSVLLVKFEDG